MPTTSLRPLGSERLNGGKASHVVNPRLLSQLAARVADGETPDAALDGLSIRRPDLRALYLARLPTWVPVYRAPERRAGDLFTTNA